MPNFNYDAVKDLLCCPKTRADLVFTGDALVSCDAQARLSYPIVDGFPVLLIDEAKPLTEAEWADVMQRNGRDPLTGRAAENLTPKG